MWESDRTKGKFYLESDVTETVFTETTINLNFWDRLKLLFCKKIIVKTKIKISVEDKDRPEENKVDFHVEPVDTFFDIKIIPLIKRKPKKNETRDSIYHP